MIQLSDITNTAIPILAKSDALQRWGALRGAGSARAEGDQTLQWVVVIGMFVVLLGFIVIPLLAYFRGRFVVLLSVLRTALAASPSTASNIAAGWTTSDVELLTRLIRQSGFIRTDMEFTLKQAFNVGTANYLGSDDYSELPGEQRREIADKIEELGGKLRAGRQDRNEQTLTTRDIPVGGQIMVSCGAASHDDFNVIVQANTEKGLTVKPSIPVESAAASSWILRYFDGLKIWSFTSPIVGKEGPFLILKHTDEMEMVNFRRFARVPVECTANVCTFTFRSPADAERPLSFVRANVVEIGGPGILLKTTLQARVGDRILIQLHLGKNEIIQSIGKVRRRNDVDFRTNWNGYGVELVGLKPSQVAELMHATNTAAIQLRKEKDKEKETETSETTREAPAVATA